MEDLEQEFAAAEASERPASHFAFKERLLESSDREWLDYHVSCIQRARNPGLHSTLCRFFSWHKAPGKQYLIERIPKESNPALLATLLQILGRMGGAEAAAFARQYNETPIRNHQKRCERRWRTDSHGSGSCVKEPQKTLRIIRKRRNPRRGPLNS